jgi:hypothetical protein
VFVCECLLVKQKVVEQTNKALDLFYNLKSSHFGKKNISFTLSITVFIRIVEFIIQRLFVSHQMFLLPECPQTDLKAWF